MLNDNTKAARRKILALVIIALLVMVFVTFIALFLWKSMHLEWDYRVIRGLPVLIGTVIALIVARRRVH